MGKKNRTMRLTNDWLNQYAKEATGILISLVAEARKAGILIPAILLTRINRLKTASAIWDQLQREVK